MNLNRRSVKFAEAPEIVRFSYRQPEWTVVHRTSGILKRPQRPHSTYCEVRFSDDEDDGYEENVFTRSFDQRRSRSTVPLSGSVDSLVSTEESNSTATWSSGGERSGWPISGTMTLGRKFSNRRRCKLPLASKANCPLQSKPALFRRYTPPGEQPVVAHATRIKVREQQRRWRPDEEEECEFEMSNHVKDCLGQFTTALDKVLSARKMLEEEADLDNCDREILLRMLNEKIAMSRRRLDGIFDDSASRTCSETTRSESAASHRNGSSMSNSRQPVTSSGAQIDQNFLDTHGAQILALLQQRVPSKQN